MYLAEFTRSDRSTFVWKGIASPQQGMQKITALSHMAPHRTSAHAAIGLPFIFRHDDFYPLDRQLFEPSEDLLIEMSRDPRWYVFDQTEIRSYYFTISESDSLSMEQNAQLEEYIPAGFEFEGKTIGTVGLRYKGSKYTLEHCFDTEGNRNSFAECRNVALKIKFNEYDETLRFYNMKKLNLHAMPYDDGKLREMLAYQLFRDMGIYTSRTAFAKVYINGVFRGLFTTVENIDGRFTKSRWPDYGDGNLYKEVWPHRLNRKIYKDALVTNEDSKQVDRMLDFYYAIDSSTSGTLLPNVSPYMDFNYFLRYIVVDRAIHNSDGIMTWYASSNQKNNHNFYFYEEENPGGRFWLVPWDLNLTLYPTDPIIDGFGVPEWNITPDSCEPMEVWSGSPVVPPNCDKLIRLTAETLWDEFVAYGEDFLSSVFSVDRMKTRIDRLVELIDPVMEDEPTVSYTRWKKQTEILRSSMETLHSGFDDYIHDRTAPVDTTGYLTPFPGDSGLLTDRVNNFEFDTSALVEPWTYTLVSDSSTATLRHSSDTPLWGKNDLLGSFIFNPLDTSEPFTEWAWFGCFFREPTDLSECKRIRMDLRLDVPRYCSIYLESDVFDSADVSDRGGWFGVISADSRRYTFEINDIAYPSWAAPDSPDLLDSALTRVKGIWISPEARFDDQGRLRVVPDSGYVHIDNIIFEF
ncbi:MAG: CotH kinase family protein [Chitinispirillaceae bacterium]|nr:CotH kinase family protein [Chitinispirillaceae bacterium]